MSGTYYDVDLSAVLALAGYPADVITDDGNTADGPSPALRLAWRKIMYRARQLLHAQAIRPRINAARTRVLVEIDIAPPAGVLVAGPMDAATCRAYLASDPAWP